MKWLIDMCKKAYIYIHIYCVALKHWGLGQAQSPRQMKKEEAKGDKK